MRGLRFNILAILALIFSVSFTSCEKDPGIISVSKDELLLKNVGITTTISFECVGNWTTSVSSLWCKVSPPSGSGDGIITITVLNNPNGDQRETKVYLSSGDTKREISVKQGYMEVVTDPEYIVFDETAGSQVLKIISNTDWTITVPGSAGWITLDRYSGTGDADLLLTVSGNPGTARRWSDIEISYDSDKSTSFSVYQKIAGEPLISKPELTSPANGASNVNRIPEFSWNAPEVSQGNEIKYYFEISENVPGNWSQPEEITYRVFYPEALLAQNRTYHWRVVAEDIDGSRSTSATYSFTTGSNSVPLDGTYTIALTSAKASPSEIIFLGDGYTPNDYVAGGKFDSDVSEGITALFDVEPFKSYKEYFKIYKMAAYSRESGASVAQNIKDTKFSTLFEGGTSTSATTDTSLVSEYASKIPGMADKLNNVLIVVISNIDRYAGTAYLPPKGGTIAIIPVSRQTGGWNDYASIMIHEAGGHGFGWLADEYIDYYMTISTTQRQKVKEYADFGRYANIDLTGVVAEIKWRHFVGRAEYDRVGVYEGAFQYAAGAWRSEVSSCMLNHEPYFNAPSREAIVKRILKTAGEEYTLAGFIAKDREKEPSTRAATRAASAPSGFIPLGPPILVK